MMIGFSGAHLLWLPAFGVNVYPYSNILIAFYPVIIGYAILRYNLLDIRIVFSRIGIFIFVYTLVLGIPFWIGVKMLGIGLWLIPTGICAILATAGPTIYLYLQRKAEERLLREEEQIQRLLKRSSEGMRTIKDLPRLLETILNLVSDALKAANASIYLLDPISEEYTVKAAKHRDKIPACVDMESSFVLELRNKKSPLIYDEIKFHSETDNERISQQEVLGRMEALGANVVVPILRDEALLGFLALGSREEERGYSEGLLNTLFFVANAAGLAIENCQYLEAQTKRMEEEGFHERIASLDMMASSFAHEIDNPMAVVKSETEFLSNEFFEEIKESLTEEKQTEFKEILTYILESSIRVSAMIKAIEEYSRMGTGELKPVRVNDAADGFLTLISPQFKKEKIKFTQNVEDKLPFVLGEKVQLEEIFMNFATNAMHAVRNRKEKIITSKVFRKDEGTVRVEFSDNGYGIPQNIINDIFLASVTTKGSSEGTGLGLFRVRKIVDLHKGKVWAESQGEGQGAKFIVELPIYKGDIRDTIKNNNNHQ